MRDCDCYVPIELIPERRLHDRIRLVICVRHELLPIRQTRRSCLLPCGCNRKEKISHGRRQGGKARTFVENDRLATAPYRTRECQYLPLHDGKVAPVTRNLAIELQTFITLRVEEPRDA
jgi:hypothetical protein